MRRGGDGCINLNNPTTQLEENGTQGGREEGQPPSGQFVEPSRGILLLLLVAKLVGRRVFLFNRE